jgi:transcription factor SPN1
MDAVLRGPNARRKKRDGIDLDALADQEIEEMRARMAKAAEADTDARAKGQPASHKLTMLAEVVSLLNRNTLRHQIVDPDINLLESVRFFLEPLNDGSLPAYNIQKELFNSLAKLPISKDTLIASGIGKVVLFYTRSIKAEPSIKRQAERLVTRWTTLLKRNDDYRRGAMANEGYVHSAQIFCDIMLNLSAAAKLTNPGNQWLSQAVVVYKAQVSIRLHQRTTYPSLDNLRDRVGRMIVHS